MYCILRRVKGAENKCQWDGNGRKEKAMGLGYDIGDRVIQVYDRVVGEVVKFYHPTACGQQTMILCDDGRKYHAPSETFIKVSKLQEEIASRIKRRLPQVAMKAGLPVAHELTQPLLIPHDYREVKIAEGMTVTIDLEELKRQLVESHYRQSGLNYGA